MDTTTATNQQQHQQQLHCQRQHQLHQQQQLNNNHEQQPSPPGAPIGGRQKGGRKRNMANQRERERTRSLNEALELLRNRLPCPEAEKRSKIQTLRVAKEYIEFLAKFNKISHPQEDQQQHQLPQHQSQQQHQQLHLHAQHQHQQHQQQHQQLQPSSQIQHQLDGPSSIGSGLIHTQSMPSGTESDSSRLEEASPLSLQAQDSSPLNIKFYSFRLETNKSNRARSSSNC